MRTDSLRISTDAADEAAAFIETRYSKEYLPPSRRVYRSRGGAQDAHEAIRPTMPSLTPDMAKPSLTLEQYSFTSDLGSFHREPDGQRPSGHRFRRHYRGDYLFKASGYSVRFDGLYGSLRGKP